MARSGRQGVAGRGPVRHRMVSRGSARQVRCVAEGMVRRVNARQAGFGEERSVQARFGKDLYGRLGGAGLGQACYGEAW